MAQRKSDSGGARNRKNIVLCADGTGNSGGKGYATNVWRLFSAIDLRCHERGSQPKQLAFYDDGVGTEEFKLLKLFGGAFGWGLSRNIRELYESLARNYEAGDRVFCFGFSRGAFTARSVAGLIAHCGVIDLRRELTREQIAQLRQAAFGWRSLAFVLGALGYFRWGAQAGRGFEDNARIKLLVAAAFNTYRARHKRNSRGSLTWIWFELMRRLLPTRLQPATHERQTLYFKETFSVDRDDDPRIQCIGVWDTVGALGAPNDALRSVMNWLWSINFHDQTLHPSVRYGFHALAIDDERTTFRPILWNERRTQANRVEENRVEQVWFAGTHSNVGGGYPKQGLANVSLYWMMRRAEFAGLQLQAGEVERARAQANVHDKLYDSRAGVGSYYSYSPRDISGLARKFCGIKPARIHYSVFDRIASGVQDYVPANLPERFEVVGDEVAGAPHPEDASVLDLWKRRLQRADIDQRRRELGALRRKAQPFIRARQLLYYAMLIATISFALGVVQLRSSSQETRQAAITDHSLARDPARIRPHRPASESRSDWPGLEPSATRLAVFVVETFLPSAAESYVHPTLDYFDRQPSRLFACLLIVLAYLKLRSWLLRRTQDPFERFWSPLRGPLDHDSPNQPEPTLADSIRARRNADTSRESAPGP